MTPCLHTRVKSSPSYFFFFFHPHRRILLSTVPAQHGAAFLSPSDLPYHATAVLSEPSCSFGSENSVFCKAEVVMRYPGSATEKEPSLAIICFFFFFFCLWVGVEPLRVRRGLVQHCSCAAHLQPSCSTAWS